MHSAPSWPQIALLVPGRIPSGPDLGREDSRGRRGWGRRR
jgi:hypothetical protein